jgi:hypothetical protein
MGFSEDFAGFVGAVPEAVFGHAEFEGGGGALLGLDVKETSTGNRRGGGVLRAAGEVRE